MNKDINQTISQFLDDELDHAELDALLTAIKNKPEIKQQINRYQVMTQVLKDDTRIQASTDFLDKINKQINQEPHYLLPKKVVEKRSIPLWQKASFAVAASVACVAVIMSQQSDLQPGNQFLQVAVVDTKIIAEPVKRKESTQPSQHERFKAYLQAHNDDLYTHGSLNIHPLARTASYR